MTFKNRKNYPLKKTEYISQADNFFKTYKAYAQIKIEGLSTKSVKAYIQAAHKRGIIALYLKNKLLKVLDRKLEDTQTFQKGISLILFASNLEALEDFVSEVEIEDKFFYAAKEISEIDLVISKSDFKLKAGLAMQTFEKIAQIKVSKGFIELLEDLVILTKGKQISEDHAKALKLLNLLIKVRRSSIIQLGLLKDLKKAPFSKKYINLVTSFKSEIANIGFVFDCVAQTANKTYKYNALERAFSLALFLKDSSLKPKE